MLFVGFRKFRLIILPVLVLLATMLFDFSPAGAASTPGVTNRRVFDVTAQSLTVRTCPDPGCYGFYTQYTGHDEVEYEANPNGNYPQGGSYYYAHVDYVQSGSGGYSDSRNGYIAYFTTWGEYYMVTARTVKNYTSSVQYIYYLSDFSRSPKGCQ
ncbi:hypothetical protein [Effusibacillus pohliae]|uniref:hypothetical protein n=1 Tax=Effusibacillus pohliae TaxID=232270 RepID=UPI0012EAF6F9|nr:hypothetical protein [Effusibacillus pohliae]